MREVISEALLIVLSLLSLSLVSFGSASLMAQLDIRHESGEETADVCYFGEIKLFSL